MAIKIITKNNIQEEVLEASTPVLIDFWASWCGPCRMLTPIVDEIAEELGDSLVVCKVNVDDQPELAAQFNVVSIPMLVVIQNGKVTNTSVGVKPKQAILDMLK